MMAPPANLALMAALAPDFPYAEALSTRQRLVFMQQGDSVLAWVIMIDKTDGANAYRYPPQLLLIDRSLRRKLKNERILFHNVLSKHYYTEAFSCQAAMELELRFHLSRIRRLIAVYQPYVDQCVI